MTDGQACSFRGSGREQALVSGRDALVCADCVLDVVDALAKSLAIAPEAVYGRLLRSRLEKYRVLAGVQDVRREVERA